MIDQTERLLRLTNHIAVFLIIVCFPITIFGQSLDSLILKHTNPKGIVHIDSLLPIGMANFYNYPDKALMMGQRLINIAENQRDPLKIASVYRFLGAYYVDVKLNFDSAYYYYGRAEKLYKSISTVEASDGEGAILHNYGTIEQYQGRYLEAITYYTQALRIFDLTDDLKVRPKTLNNLSILYAFVKDNQKAEIYARKCIALARQKGDEFMIATGNLALASALIEEGKEDGVVEIIEEALRISEKSNNIQSELSSHFNYGNYYGYVKNDYPRAIQEYKKSMELAVFLSNEWEMAKINPALSEMYLLNKQPYEAQVSAEKSLLISRKMKIKDIEQRTLWVLAKIYAHNLNFNAAYEHLNAAYALRDTILNESNQRHITFLEAEYQSEKKELRISSLEKQRKLYTWLGIAGTIILLIALALAIIRYRLAVSKRKLAEQEAKRLKQEKQLVAVQATLDGESAERSRLAKDLHDGLGSMLSVVKFNLPQMKGGVVLESVDVSRFQKAIGMLDDSIQELRRVAHHMMPETLLRYGLKVSLTDFCEAIPMADFHYFGNEARLPEKLEVMVYRSIHELVNNAIKHAQATHVNIQLVQEEDRLSFTIQDDGKGFDQNSVSEGMGLGNIRQRVEAYQGKMNIYSSPQGTEIHVELELTKDDQE